ncbi:hypothetical protein [Vallitalea maricola]|uniref:Uncharacterized protein n=1 Tax=Vallitalea maricola TaxID=3074433 RepID=A0ACB5UMJ0_9FIRM|nr:hypothetical protein AN2V17_34180 [Vallitalea sp. AN17-2]
MYQVLRDTLNHKAGTILNKEEAKNIEIDDCNHPQSWCFGECLDCLLSKGFIEEV